MDSPKIAVLAILTGIAMLCGIESGSMIKERMLNMHIEQDGLNVYIATDGDDRNPGTEDRPLASLKEARNRIRQLKGTKGLPKGAVTIWIKDGIYRFDETLKLSAEDSGTEDSPIIYRAREDGEVTFDGSRNIPTESLEPVTDQDTLVRLSPTAKGEVMQINVTDSQLVELLRSSGSRLSFNGKMMQLARFPNVGYAHIDRILEKGAVYTHGRTFGPAPEYSMENPVGGEFTIYEQHSGKWEEELKRTQKAEVTGYLSYDWYKENHRIASIKDGVIKLQEYSRYGILGREKIPRRFYVTNLLCELDQPGEWYFDEIGSKLFIWPFEPMDESTVLGVWAGPSFVELSGASHTTFQGLTIQGVASGQGMIVIEDGEHNRIVGCTLRNSTRNAVVLKGGNDNGILSCDLYDVSGHLLMGGGDARKLIPARNYAINCHFTQVQASDFYGRISVGGVGNIFRNNLVHNFVGQIMTLGGNDHIVELNEIFNVGTEEGDGGAIYCGAQMWSYGNVFRHNFLHHLMCVPQAHPRGGIYPDDHDAGDTITENIFYKAAHRAVLINGGAGHTVTSNIFLNGYIGIYNTLANAEKAYNAIPRFDSGEAKRGDKGDYIWRTERVVGKEGWNKEPWSSRYPLFKKIMNQEKMRFYPIECKFNDNLFSNNAENIQFRVKYGNNGVEDIETVPYIETSGNREIGMDLFIDPDSMDFRYKKNVRETGLPDIPFDKIGLYEDQCRHKVPDKRSYRAILRQKFETRPSYSPDAKYSRDEINGLIYFNTGKLLIID